MGILYRDSRTIKYVRVGKRTIKAGEAAAIWNMNGEHREVVGPRLVRLLYSTIRFLDRHIAGPNEYLVVTHIDGRIEHVRGPTAMFCNPVKHQSVVVKKGVVLASPLECLVVYQQGKANTTPLEAVPSINDADLGASKEVAFEKALQRKSSNIGSDHVSRRVMVGPTLFTPEVGEWMHKFVWTSLESGKKEKETFSVLNTGARRWDVAIPFRTADSVKITARLSLEFRINSLPSLLDGCQDPIAALQSLLKADLGEFGTLIRSDDLLTTEARNKIAIQVGDLATYKKLTDGATHMGINVVGLCLHGIDASEGMQKQYNHAIETKAKLEANRAIAAQKQEMADLELSNQQRRMENEQAISAGKIAHKLKMNAQQSDVAFAHDQRSNELALRFLQGLGECGVDLTAYLTSFAGQQATIKNLHQAPAFSHLQTTNPPAPVQCSALGGKRRPTPRTK